MSALDRFARLSRLAIMLLAIAAWVLAYLLWRFDQSPSALVLAVTGYLLIRSTRKITFNLAWRRFARRDGFRELLLALDDHFILGGEAAMRAEIERATGDERDTKE